jgi:hypothetical protein
MKVKANSEKVKKEVVCLGSEGNRGKEGLRGEIDRGYQRQVGLLELQVQIASGVKVAKYLF